MSHASGPVVLMLLMVAAPLAIAAQVYKCVDPKTKAVSYQNAPCVTGDVSKLSITDTAIMDGRAAQKEIARDRAAEQSRKLQTQREIAAQQREQASAMKQSPTREGVADAALVAQRDRLAGECERRIQESCRALRALNEQGPGSTAPATGGSAAQKEKLAARCSRGFQDSCEASRALNGEQEETQEKKPSGRFAEEGAAKQAASDPDDDSPHKGQFIRNCDERGCTDVSGNRYTKDVGSEKNFTSRDGRQRQCYLRNRLMQCF